jgi:hypothetical protein
LIEILKVYFKSKATPAMVTNTSIDEKNRRRCCWADQRFCIHCYARFGIAKC